MAFKLKSGNKPTFKMMGSTNNMGQNIMQAKNAAKQGLVPGLGGAFTKTYDEAWDAMDKATQAKYSDKADFVNQAKRYNEKKYGTTDPTKKAERLDVSKKELEEINKPKQMKKKAPEPIKSGTGSKKDDKPADKKVDPKTMEVGKKEGNAGDKVKVSYVRKSAKDAPGAEGNKKKDEATPVSETKSGKAAADRAAVAETRKKQTKRQAVRDAKKSADYDTNDRQERKNIRDEAAAMSGEAYGKSRRDLKKAQKEERTAKRKANRKRNKSKNATGEATDSPVGTMSKDPKTPMARKKKY